MSEEKQKHPEETIAKVVKTFGFDPAREEKITSDLLKSVMEEVREERIQKAKTRAKEIITKVTELRNQFEGARKAYQKAEQQFNKEVGSLLKRLDSALSDNSEEESSEEGNSSS